MEFLQSLTSFEQKKYDKISGANFHLARNLDCSFLYLGKHQQPSTESSSHKSYYVENLLSARTKLVRILEQRQTLPQLVVIDVPFVRNDVRTFLNWFKLAEEFQHIPVVYNQAALTRAQIDELQKLRLVDDVMDLSLNATDLSKKARFLQKVKQYRKEETNSLEYIREAFVRPATTTANYSLKRILDIAIASLCIIASLPILLLIALAIRIESKGPIIYAAKRAGRGFRIFKFYKFRTMVVDADKKVADLAKLNIYNKENAPAKFFKLQNDPRVTKVGAFLRNTSLDELPQFFNVLIGDMSIVGNRPLPLYEAAALTTNEWAERFMAPAGITGLWQIKKRGTADMSDEERIGLDISYARTNNVVNDIWIMVNTPSALLQKTNV